MKFKPATWFPIAGILSVLNLLAVGFVAARGHEPLHATAHAALAVAFAVWALHLRGKSEESDDVQPSHARVEVLEAEVSDLRLELSKAQEGLHFTEQLLANRQEPVRVDAVREAPPQ